MEKDTMREQLWIDVLLSALKSNSRCESHLRLIDPVGTADAVLKCFDLRFRSAKVESVQFLVSSNPETWPEGVVWGGDLPDGTGCYVIKTAEGDICLSDGDWIAQGDHVCVSRVIKTAQALRKNQ